MWITANVEVSDVFTSTVLVNRESVVSLRSAHGVDILMVVNPLIRNGLRYEISSENVIHVSIEGVLRNKLKIFFQSPTHKLEINNPTNVIEKFQELFMILWRAVGNAQAVNAPTALLSQENLDILPLTLLLLKIRNVRMSCVPSSIIRLQFLIQVELENCDLFKIPIVIGDLPNLVVLILSYNKLGTQNSWDFLARPHIRSRLKLLNLQANKLQMVPNEVMGLESLKILLLDKNAITSIPNGLKTMNQLRLLGISSNMIKIFPYNMLPLNIFHMDISNNPLISRYFVKAHAPRRNNPPTLQELSARVAVDYGLHRSSVTVPVTLMDYLQRAKSCAICTGAYFDNFVSCQYLPIFKIYREIFPENRPFFNPNTLVNLCSRRCLEPELKFCEVLSHLTPEEYDEWMGVTR